MPSSQEIPGPIHLLSSLCPNYWLLLALTVIEPVAIGSYSYQTSFNSLLSSLRVLWKYCYFKMLSSTFSCTALLSNVFDLDLSLTRVVLDFWNILPFKDLCISCHGIIWITLPPPPPSTRQQFLFAIVWAMPAVFCFFKRSWQILMRKIHGKV